MVIAALDVGIRRIGIAVTDSAMLSAYPLCTLERRSLKSDLEAITRTLATRGVNCIIVGLPLNMDGSEGPMARHVRNFAERLGEATGLRIELHDERLSSFEAEQRTAGLVRRGKKKQAIDAVAAAVILESWLESHRDRPPD